MWSLLSKILGLNLYENYSQQFKIVTLLVKMQILDGILLIALWFFTHLSNLSRYSFVLMYYWKYVCFYKDENLWEHSFSEWIVM